MSHIETWVNDQLHDILGISDKYIGQYLIGLAKKAKSADEYVQNLKDTGTIDIDQKMVAFSNELWNKVNVLFMFLKYSLYIAESSTTLKWSLFTRTRTVVA